MKYIILMVLVFLIFGCSDDPVSSNESKLELALISQNSSLTLGDQVQLDILINECTTPIFGICLQIDFNSDVLSLSSENSIVSGDFLGENYVAFAQESNGVVYVTYTLVQDEALLSGDGTLCSLFLESTNIGVSTINLISEEISVFDQDGNQIEFDTIETNNTEITIL